MKSADEFCAAVMFAYEQCLLVLGHHPDIWYEAAQYLEQSSKLLAEKGVRDDTLLAESYILHVCHQVPSPLSLFLLLLFLHRT